MVWFKIPLLVTTNRTQNVPRPPSKHPHLSSKKQLERVFLGSHMQLQHLLKMWSLALSGWFSVHEVQPNTTALTDIVTNNIIFK